MVLVTPAIRVINTAGQAPAIAEPTPWCSATQYRWYPTSSARPARATLEANASLALPPGGTGDRSTIESFTDG
jgi:hypothetical protein